MNLTDGELELIFTASGGLLMAMEELGAVTPDAKTFLTLAFERITEKPITRLIASTSRNKIAAQAGSDISREVLMAFCERVFLEADSVGVDLGVDRGQLLEDMTYTSLRNLVHSIQDAIKRLPQSNDCQCPSCQENRGEVDPKKAVEYMVAHGMSRSEAMDIVEQQLNRPKPLTKKEIDDMYEAIMAKESEA